MLLVFFPTVEVSLIWTRLRDPPSLVASSELRDLSLQPSTVRPTEITIIHQQLRDLILPLERGKVLYPRGTAIEQLCWEPENEEDGSSVSPCR